MESLATSKPSGSEAEGGGESLLLDVLFEVSLHSFPPMTNITHG